MAKVKLAKKGKFSVTDTEINGCTLTPFPTVSEERIYYGLLDDADIIRSYVCDATEHLRDADDEELRRRFPPERAAQIAKLVSRAESALLELEDALDEVIESDNDDYEKALLLNELDAAVKKVAANRKRRLVAKRRRG